MIKYLSDLGVMYMIKSNQILDEKDKRLRKKSIDVTFPLEDKYKCRIFIILKYLWETVILQKWQRHGSSLRLHL